MFTGSDEEHCSLKLGCILTSTVTNPLLAPQYNLVPVFSLWIKPNKTEVWQSKMVSWKRPS